VVSRRNQLDITSTAPSARRAFTMVDLLVSIAVIAILIGLITPTLAHVKGAADKVVCASNLRQVGLLLTMYADDHEGLLPEEFQSQSRAVEDLNDPQIAHTGEHPQAWSGLGWLVADGYLTTPEVFYCPAHEGFHSHEDYSSAWVMLDSQIRTNYAYRDELANAGPVLPVPGETLAGDRVDGPPPHSVLISDGFASAGDVNHRTGFNTLSLGLSIAWISDEAGQVRAELIQGIENDESWTVLDRVATPDFEDDDQPDSPTQLLLGALR